MSRRRHLSDEEQALWAGLARSITPLPKAKSKPKSDDKPDPGKAGAKSAATPARQPAAKDAPPRPAAPPPPLAPLDRRLKQRVARGREPIDARIDLHGMTQAQAHAALLRFLHRAQADGIKTALVVTGKGSGKSSSNAERERGVLKRQVPLWLALPEFRLLVVGFDDAHVGHGGEGALYVRLRRARGA
jgi:DNA-nicking Smr family endonuclease